MSRIPIHATNEQCQQDAVQRKGVADEARKISDAKFAAARAAHAAMLNNRTTKDRKQAQQMRKNNRRNSVQERQAALTQKRSHPRAATADPAFGGSLHNTGGMGRDLATPSGSPFMSSRKLSKVSRTPPAPMLPLGVSFPKELLRDPMGAHEPLGDTAAGQAFESSPEGMSYKDWGFADTVENTGGAEEEMEEDPETVLDNEYRWVNERPWSQVSMQATQSEITDENVRRGARNSKSSFRRPATVESGASVGSLFAAPGLLTARSGKDAIHRPRGLASRGGSRAGTPAFIEPVEDPLESLKGSPKKLKQWKKDLDDMKHDVTKKINCGRNGRDYIRSDSKPVRDKITGGVISLKQVQGNLKDILHHNYHMMRKDMRRMQLFMPGPPEFEAEMELDEELAPLVESTGFSETELYTLVTDFLKVAKNAAGLKLANAVTKAVIDYAGFKQIIATRLFSIPNVLKRIWKVMDDEGAGDVKMFNSEGQEIEVITFPELATGLMYFKENDKVQSDIFGFVRREEFKVAVIKMFDNNDNQVISKLCMYAMLSRFDRQEQYELADSIFEVISEDGGSLYCVEFARRFDSCMEEYPDKFGLIMYYIMLMQGAQEDSYLYELCKQNVMDLTTQWRQRKKDFRFVFMDRLVGQLKVATGNKDEEAVQKILEQGIAFSNKKRGIENTRAMFYVKVMREIRRSGWGYVEEEMQRINSWLSERNATDTVGNPNMSLSDNDKKRAIFLEQLKRGVMKAYMEQLIAERRKQEEALEAKKAQKMLEDQQEKERVEKARSRGYLA